MSVSRRLDQAAFVKQQRTAEENNFSRMLFMVHEMVTDFFNKEMLPHARGKKRSNFDHPGDRKKTLPDARQCVNA